MSRQTFRTLFTSAQVQTILADWVLAQRGIEVKSGGRADSELMAIATKDENGFVQMNHYRLEFTADVTDESWRG